MLEKPGKVLYINYRFCDGLEKPDKVQVIYLREKSLTGCWKKLSRCGIRN